MSGRSLLVGALLVGLTVSTQAQDGRDFVDSLLRSLIDSQINRDQPSNNKIRPTIPPQQPNDPNLVRVQPLIDSLGRETTQLVYALRAEERTTPQVRTFLAEAIQLQASASLLQRQLQTASRFDDLRNSFQQFDQQWRVLAHRIQSTPDIGRSCLRSVDAVGAIEKQLVTAFGIEPQLDRQELLRLSSSFTNSFGRLLQDVRYDLIRHPNRVQLINEGQQLYTKINQAMSLIDRAPYDNLINAYQVCQQDWRQYSAKLRSTRSDRIQRDIVEIEEIGRAIAEQLWMEVPTDTGYILQLAQTVERDTDQIMQRMSLAQLIEMQNPLPMIESAREFHNVAHRFAETAARTSSLDVLSWDFRALEVQWNDFQRHIYQVQSPEVQQLARDLARGIDVLQRSLRLQPTYDRRELTQVAARLDDLSAYLQQLGEQYVERGNYRPPVRNQFKRELDHFHDEAHDLHDQLLQVDSDQAIARTAREVIEEWIHVKESVQQLNQIDQQRLYQAMAQIEPLMVKLQVVFHD